MTRLQENAGRRRKPERHTRLTTVDAARLAFGQTTGTSTIPANASI
jgi:hypothetical protein